MPLLIYLCFCLSGATALVCELTWSRALVHVFGASLYAVATVNAAFLGGLAGGAALGALYLRQRKPHASGALYLYAACEIVVCIFALMMPQLTSADALQAIIGGGNPAAMPDALVSLLRFAASAVLVGIPALAMGATYPAVVQAASGNAGSGSGAAANAYAVNSLGAAVGALVTGFVLLPTLGLSMTGTVAACTAGLAAAIAAALALRSPVSRSTREATPAPAVKKKPGSGRFLALAFAAGALSLAMQTAWFRFFCLVLGSSIYSQTCALVIACLSCAIASTLVVALYRLCKQGKPLAFLFAALAALSLTIVLFCLDELPWLFLSVEKALRDMSGVNAFNAAVIAPRSR